MTKPAPLTESKMARKPPKTITVCDKCLRACCWQGIFFCEDAYSAGTVEKTRHELRKLGLEHSDYWRTK